jgi:hypothetical protein
MAVVATAILDRMLHHSHVLTIRGDSYRLRSKRRSGLLNQGSPAAKNSPFIEIRGSILNVARGSEVDVA